MLFMFFPRDLQENIVLLETTTILIRRNRGFFFWWLSSVDLDLVFYVYCIWFQVLRFIYQPDSRELQVRSIFLPLMDVSMVLWWNNKEHKLNGFQYTILQRIIYGKLTSLLISAKIARRKYLIHNAQVILMSLWASGLLGGLILDGYSPQRKLILLGMSIIQLLV